MQLQQPKNIIKKLEKIKFLIPIVLGIIFLWGLNHLLSHNKQNNLLFYLGSFYLFYCWTKHWWKMARDEEYKKERIRWLALPIDQKGTGWWSRAKLDLVATIILSVILLFLLLCQILIINQ